MLRRLRSRGNSASVFIKFLYYAGSRHFAGRRDAHCPHIQWIELVRAASLRVGRALRRRRPLTREGGDSTARASPRPGGQRLLRLTSMEAALVERGGLRRYRPLVFRRSSDVFFPFFLRAPFKCTTFNISAPLHTPSAFFPPSHPLSSLTQNPSCVKKLKTGTCGRSSSQRTKG